jgi:putative SOS response-associated peptidase YedK
MQMCGRHFRHGVSWEEYHAQLSLFRPEEIPEINPAYNVAPTQLAPIIRLRDDSDDLELAFARWGLVPRWWKKPLSEKKFSTFNAKSEDVAEKPTFRAAFKDRPCLLPMSGYYEWTGKKSSKQAFAIAMRNRRWFCVAGLWDRAYVEGEPIDSFTILTKAASDEMADLHHRMPVIPSQSEGADWIRSSPDERHEIIQAANADQLYFWKVGPAVGNVRNQGEELIKEIGEG